jgi:hypothetical protein
MDALRLATLESDINCGRTGRDLGAVLGTIYLAPKQGEQMDTKPKDNKPTEFDLEIAVFSAP